VSVLYIGGIFGRMESVAVGAPLIQAFESEHHGVSGQVIVSPECWDYLKKYYEGLEINKGTNNTEDKGPGMEDMGEGFMLIHQNGWETMAAFLENKKMIKQLAFKNDIEDDPTLIQAIKFYVPGGVTAHIDETNDEEKWYNEERNVATLFVNLGLEDAILLEAAEKNSAMNVVNEVLASVQKAVYQYEGSINKFLMDDKGSTLIACFGLTPNAHEDDAVRAVLAAINICEQLLQLNRKASIGVTFGSIFCGVVGSRGRREYSILGDPVNLSARLMQQACTEVGGVICDASIKVRQVVFALVPI
jgi:hypothetical protein